jgi:hypothetical protein
MGQLLCVATKQGLTPQPKNTMATIIVVNHAITGTTAQLAQAVLEGVRSVKGCTGKLLTIDGAHRVGQPLTQARRQRQASESGLVECGTYSLDRTQGLGEVANLTRTTRAS